MVTHLRLTGPDIQQLIETNALLLRHCVGLSVSQLVTWFTVAWSGLHVVMCVMHRSAVKVISQPNPQFGHGNDNPLSILGQALFPPGSTNAPMEQLQQFYRLGVQAMSKAQSAGGETRSNSVSVFTGMLISVITNVQCLKWKKKCLDAPTQAPLLALLPPLPSSTTRSRVPKW